MDLTEELKDRLRILCDSGMISHEVTVFCMKAVRIILNEKADADAEKLNMLITHLAMAADRMERRKDGETAISPELLESVKREKSYPRACATTRKVLECTKLKFTGIETDFLTIHLCNLYM